jgi:hypothetical protein
MCKVRYFAQVKGVSKQVLFLRLFKHTGYKSTLHSQNVNQKQMLCTKSFAPTLIGTEPLKD